MFLILIKLENFVESLESFLSLQGDLTRGATGTARRFKPEKAVHRHVLFKKIQVKTSVLPVLHSMVPCQQVTSFTAIQNSLHLIGMQNQYLYCNKVIVHHTTYKLKEIVEGKKFILIHWSNVKSNIIERFEIILIDPSKSDRSI